MKLLIDAKWNEFKERLPPKVEPKTIGQLKKVYYAGAQDTLTILHSIFAQDNKRQSPYKGTPRKIGRNDTCPCGSGKKFKKCCLQQTTTDLKGSQKLNNDLFQHDS